MIINGKEKNVGIGIYFDEATKRFELKNLTNDNIIPKSFVSEVIFYDSSIEAESNKDKIIVTQNLKQRSITLKELSSELFYKNVTKSTVINSISFKNKVPVLLSEFNSENTGNFLFLKRVIDNGNCGRYILWIDIKGIKREVTEEQILEKVQGNGFIENSTKKYRTIFNIRRREVFNFLNFNLVKELESSIKDTFMFSNEKGKMFFDITKFMKMSETITYDHILNAKKIRVEIKGLKKDFKEDDYLYSKTLDKKVSEYIDLFKNEYPYKDSGLFQRRISRFSNFYEVSSYNTSKSLSKDFPFLSEDELLAVQNSFDFYKENRKKEIEIERIEKLKK